MQYFPPVEIMSALLRFADQIEQIRPSDRIRSPLLPEFAQRQLDADETSICCMKASKSAAAKLFVTSAKIRTIRYALDRSYTHCRVRSFALPAARDGDGALQRVVCVGLIKRTGNLACMVCARHGKPFSKPELRAAHMAFEYAFHSASDELASPAIESGDLLGRGSGFEGEDSLGGESSREAISELRRLFNS